MTTRQPPLLVTGLPRTGTSWVGKMLEASGQVVYVNEPLNPEHPPGRCPGILDATVTHRYQYICADNEDGWHRAFARTVALRYGFRAELRRNHRPYDLARLAKYGTSFTAGRLRGRQALLDDPFAILSVPWLVERFGARAVVLVRDPVAFAGSFARLGWRVRFADLLDQPLLVRDLPAELVALARRLAGESDQTRCAAGLWRIVYDVVDRVHRNLPGVTVQRYEDLATDPLPAFAGLYAHCRLDFHDRAAERVRAATSGTGDSSGGHRWTLRFGPSKTAFRPMDSRQAVVAAARRLSAEQAAAVRAGTADVAPRFGYPAAPS